MTKLVTLSRQLSAVLAFLWTMPAAAQLSVATRAMINNEPAISAVPVPTYDAKKTMLFVNKVSITPNGQDDSQFRSFYVRPDLTLGVQYNYKFRFNFTASDAQGARRAVPDGYYQITIATFLKASDARKYRNETLEDRFVTRSATRSVRITGGEGTALVSLRFDNPTLAAVDNTLYIEFVPLESRSCVPGKKLSGCLTIDQNGEIDSTRSDLKARDTYYPYLMNMDFLPYAKANAGDKNDGMSKFTTEILKEGGLAQFTTHVVAKRSRVLKRYRRRVTTPAAYAEQYNLNLMDLNDPSLARINEPWLKGASPIDIIRQVLDAEGGGPIRSRVFAKTLRKIFCRYLAQRAVGPTEVKLAANNGTPYAGLSVGMCGSGAEVQMDFRRVQHVGEVAANYAERTKSSILKYVLMNNLTQARTHDEGMSRAFAAKPSVILLKAADIFGFIPFEYTQTVTFGNSRSESQAATSSTQEYIDLLPTALNIPTTNTRACLEVTLSSRYSTSLLDPRTGVRNGFYICDAVRDHVDVQEIYMHAFTRMSDSSWADAHDRLTQTLNLSLRGDRDVSALFHVTRKALSAEKDERLPNWYSEQAVEYFRNTPLATPGLVITPVISGDTEVPSFFEKLLSPTYREHFNPAPRS